MKILIRLKKQEHNISDTQLVSLLQNKDRKGVSLLYDRYSAALYGVILRIVKAEDMAENVLQDTFVKIWKNIGSYDPSKGRLFTWMLNIARYAAIDFVRSKNYKQDLKTKTIDVSVHTKHMQASTVIEGIGVREKVKKLELKYREVIDLIYFGGYTQAEVAEHLNLPLGTVKSRARIAIRELRKLFKE